MISTAGFPVPGAADRNQMIIKYVNDVLGRVNNPVPLYDVRYQAFHPKDIKEAKEGKLDDGSSAGKQWQEWFTNLFEVYPVNELYIVDEQALPFKHYYYRDHQVILDRHPTSYPHLTLDNIIHIDDSPRTVVTLNPDNVNVQLLTVDRDHQDKIAECDLVFSKIEAFVKARR